MHTSRSQRPFDVSDSLSREHRQSWRVVLAVIFLGVGGMSLCAQVPETLLFVPKGEIMASDYGLLTIGLAGGEEIFVTPVLVDHTTGKWTSAKEISPFTPDDGKEIESSGTFSWGEGAEASAVITFKAAIVKNQVQVKMAWTLTGDSPGHMRADIRIPASLARTLSAVDSGGEALYEDGKPMKVNRPLPVDVKTADGATFFTIESDDDIKASFFVPPDDDDGTRFEKEGLTVRLSNYPPGATCSLSERDSMQYTLTFPK